MITFPGTAAAVITRKALRLMGKGATTLPGKLAIRISPSVIREKSRGKHIITITGTNGKTTTSHMISEMLNYLGYDVINNISGANLASGIATTLICGKDEMMKAEGQSKGTIYVLETDEAAYAKTAGDLQPDVSVITNLFRDQLDRYGELTHTRDCIADGLAKTSATAVINSDDSLVASLGKGREDKTVYYGMGKEDMLRNNTVYPPKMGILPASPDAVYCPDCHVRYEYRSRSFGHLGDFRCPSCGFVSPASRFEVRYDLGRSPSDEDYPFGISDSVTGETSDMKLRIPGSHNLYNTCAAVSAVTVMLERLGTDSKTAFEQATNAAGHVKAAFGRMEKIDVGGKKLCILLVKNPVGFDRSLSFVGEAEDAAGLMLLLNSNTADGKDVSWIWDVDLESKADSLPGYISVSGDRWGDMLLRIEYAGLVSADSGDMSRAMEILKAALDQCPEGKCLYVMPNYTAMLSLRADLVREYGLKEFWK